MPSKLRIAAVLAAFFAGCSFVLEITLLDSAVVAPTFELRKPAIFFIGSTTPDVRYLLVSEPGHGGSKPPPVIWSLVSLEGGGALRQVTYGVVPEGFREQAPAPDLVPGRTYLIEVHAWGGSGGLKFEVEIPPASTPG